MRATAVALVVIGVLLGGCALKAPPPAEEIRTQTLTNLSLPAQWTAAATSAAPAVDNWLATFEDTTLEALVAEAFAHNADLRFAAANVDRAAAQIKVASATLFPIVDLLARGGGKLGGDSSGLQGVLLTASWELDVWGRVRYGQASTVAQHAATLADFESARQSLAANVARSWFLAREARQQRALAASAVADGERLIALAIDRERVGSGDSYDIAVANASLEVYRDALVQADLAQAQAVRALETLLGRYPAAALEVPSTLATLPELPRAGVPAELLERRPDVAAAERRVAAAFNRTEEAKVAMLPRLALTAGVSSVSSELFVLQDHSNPVASIGANLLAPIFHGGALRANVEVRNAEQQQAVADYGRVAIRAFGEVENALANEANLRIREPILSRAVIENARAVELAGIRVRVGSGDVRGVLQQQLALYASRSAVIRVQSEQRLQRVNLYLALGGGLVESVPRTAALQIPSKGN
jgi:NodT family efflux transporter outer membrane factor (OMF) lipoprotein